jgi:hypothetical protein
MISHVGESSNPSYVGKSFYHDLDPNPDKLPTSDQSPP